MLHNHLHRQTYLFTVDHENGVSLRWNHVFLRGWKPIIEDVQ